MDISLDGFEEAVDVLSASASCSSTQQDSPFTFCVGEALLKMKEYEQAHFMKFWKRDSRTVEAAKRCVTRYLRCITSYAFIMKLHFAALMVGKSSNPVEKVYYICSL